MSKRPSQQPKPTDGLEGIDKPTIVVNRFVVRLDGETARLVVGEQMVENLPAVWHNAFLMSLENFEGLIVLGQQLIAQHKAKNEAPAAHLN